jgi:hypothetical protein
MSRKCLIKFWIATAIFGALLIDRYAAHPAISAGATAGTWSAMEHQH